MTGKNKILIERMVRAGITLTVESPIPAYSILPLSVGEVFDLLDNRAAFWANKYRISQSNFGILEDAIKEGTKMRFYCRGKTTQKKRCRNYDTSLKELSIDDMIDAVTDNHKFRCKSHGSSPRVGW